MSRRPLDAEPKNLESCKWDDCTRPRMFNPKKGVNGNYRSPYCSMHYSRYRRGSNMDAPARSNESRVPSDRRQGRHRDRLKRFSLSELEYATMLVAQNGLCAMCGLPESGKSLAIDHDHSCCAGNYSCGGCVRGLLCTRCNIGLSYFSDSVELFRAAISYLGSDPDAH